MGFSDSYVAEGSVDSARLERSLKLSGQRIAPGKYLVTGGEEQHWVDLDDPFRAVTAGTTSGASAPVNTSSRPSSGRATSG